MSDAPKKSSSLKMRVISGIVLCPLMIATLVAGGWYFLAVLGLAFVIAMTELSKMLRAAPQFFLLFLVAFIYICGAFASYIYLRFEFPAGAWLALIAMISVWASDSGAYFMGKSFGKHKMAPHISPNKTWEGFGGAVFFSGLFLVIMALLAPVLAPYLVTDLGKNPNIALFFVLGGILGGVGQVGDIVESYAKRKVGVKDAGAIIPGHGGLLDRIDSLLLVSPVFLGIVLLWM